jgi:regulator of RNase E activity RraA
MVVMPGDIIVGDADGIVAVPQSHAKEILDSAKSILVKETKNLKEIKAGTVNRDWVVKGLRDKGYTV